MLYHCAFRCILYAGHAIYAQSVLFFYKSISELVLIELVKNFLSQYSGLFLIGFFWYVIPFRFCFLEIKVFLNIFWT